MRFLCFVFSLAVLILSLIVPAHAASLEVDPPVTVYDQEGNIVYSNEIETPSEFLYKEFEEYTVTEGFLLLFLILAFCALLWNVVKGVL